MLIKIMTICVASWFSLIKMTVCESPTHPSGSVSRKYVNKYKHTVTPVTVKSPAMQASSKIQKLPTNWIITKKR